MKQKEALARGFSFGATTGQAVMKRIRDHVLWKDFDQIAPDEWEQVDRALLMLDPIARKYQAAWDERVRRLNEADRQRRQPFLDAVDKMMAETGLDRWSAIKRLRESKAA